MVEICDSCKLVFEIVERHFVGNEFNVEKQLEKQEVNLLIQWIRNMADFKSSCRCPFRDIEQFWNLMKVLRKLYDVAGPLIENFNEAYLEFSHMRQILAENSNDSQDSVDEEEIETDGYTLKDRGLVIEVCAQLLIDNFFLWVSYQRLYGHTQNPFPENHVKMKKLLNSTHISPPILFLLEGVFESNILTKIASCLSKISKPLLPPECMLKLMYIMLTIKNHVSEYTLKRFILPLRDCMLKYLCDIADSQGDLLREPSVRQLSDNLWNLGREFSSDCVVDAKGLLLAVKHLNSPFLAPRLAGLHQINLIISNTQEIGAEDLDESLANFLQSNEVVQTVFGPNLHVELVKQSHVLLNYLALRQKLTKRELDCVWTTSHIKHCGRQVLDLLMVVVKNMDPELIVHLYGLLKTLKPSEHNDLTLHLTSKVIKSIWTLVILKNTHLRRQEENSTSMIGGDQRRNVISKKSPSSSNFSQNFTDEADLADGDGDKESEKLNSADSIVYPILHIGGGDVSEQSTINEVNSTASSSSSPPPLTYVPDDPMTVSTSTPLKRASGQPLDSTSECSPVNKRAKTDELQKNSLSSRLSDLKGLKITIEDGSAATLKHSISNVVGTTWERNCSPRGSDEERSSSSSLDECDERNARRLKKFVKKTVMPGRRTLIIDGQNVRPTTMVDVLWRGGVTGELRPSDKSLPEGVRPLVDVVFHGRDEDCQLLSGNNLLETLVKNKPAMYIDRSMEISDSEADMSSDAATSSDRLCDFDEEEYMRHNCSPIEDEEEDIVLDNEYDDPTQRNRSVTVSRYDVSRLMQQQQRKMVSNFSSSSSSHLVNWSVRSESVTDELIDFDLTKLASSGQTLLWDLIQDDLYEECLSIDNENLTLHLLEELIVCNPFAMRQFLCACIDNMAQQRSTFVSVKLLYKLLASSRNLNCGAQCHNAVLYCDSEFKLVDRVVQDLAHVRESNSKSRYGEEAEIKVRLNFLEYIFSNQSTSKSFVLKRPQLEILWNCLSKDDVGREFLYVWLLEQLKPNSKHAIDVDMLNYILQKKANCFNPDTLSNSGLALLHTFLQDNAPESASVVLPLLWQVALRNADTSVGLSAMQFISDYYVYSGGSKCKEKEFIDWCMEHLRSACTTIDANLESSLMIIHRALNLLYSHIDSFRKRYSFHLRLWELEGRGVTSHCKIVNQTFPEFAHSIKVNLQVGNSTSDKTPLLLNFSDLVSQLRAEIHHWWHTRRTAQQQQNGDKQQQRKTKIDNQNSSFASSGELSPFIPASAKGNLRLIVAGHELTHEMDDRTLMDISMKDCSTIMVCPSGAKVMCMGQKSTESTSLPNAPDPELTPMKLLGENHWQLLMNLAEKLNSCVKQDSDVSFRCRTYCMRAWEVIQSLPTSTYYLEKLTNVCSLAEETSFEIQRQNWEDYFQTSRRLAFLYALQVLESNLIQFKDSFQKSGGLDFIIQVLLSKKHFPNADEVWDQWTVECVTSMVRLIYSVISPPVIVTNQDRRQQLLASSRRHHSSGRAPEIIFNMVDLKPFSVASPNDVVSLFLDLIAELSSDRVDSIFCPTIVRLHGISCCSQLLISLLFSSTEFENGFMNYRSLPAWLKRILLECGEMSLRREISNGLYRLCRGKRSDGAQVGRNFVSKLVFDLLASLDDAEKIAPPKRDELDERKELVNDGKECFGVSPLNYFYLLTNLIDFMRDDFLNREIPAAISNSFDEICVKIFDFLERRSIFELRDSNQTDYGLHGLLQLATCLVKFNPPWKTSARGLKAVSVLFDMIFMPPTKQFPLKPKCKTQNCRVATFDLLVELAKGFEPSYLEIHKLLMIQNSKQSHDFYPWDYWPADERRATCGFVGVMNLGATCYMASAIQQLFMLPKFRTTILNADANQIKEHEPALRELQRMFTFLLLSERKAYNPRSFCKSYIMNHQPLNITEQKDMNEFFTDLITKVDEMSPEFKKMVKNLFGGVMSNNVVSMDCNHVSKTTEVFYSVRSAVADMKNLYDSLNSITVADMLEGDNMYTCSQCNKKVRAEKRACFKQLPKILCFNTLRYTFNMITMMKEKVNTHFSFPMRLNMSAYMEENLLPDHASQTKDKEPNSGVVNEYELIGVTVHTGTAEGGHYYSFIKDRNVPGSENWYCFNDAEVRPWDPSNMDAECFGGELTKQQYDTVTEKYLDLSYEKTNSAYMLFYERLPLNVSPSTSTSSASKKSSMDTTVRPLLPQNVKLSEEFEIWIYDDNKRFIQDLMFFDHAYSNFVWQISSQVPSTLLESNPCDLTLLTSKLSLSYVLETLIHSKEKPTLTGWTELVLKDLSSSPKACEWFFEHSSKNSDWLTEILIGSPSKINREMFQKLCLHAILQLHLRHEPLYLLPWEEGQNFDTVDSSLVGQSSCVTQFIRQLLSLISRPNPNLDTRQLNEYFTLILEFGRSSNVALKFLLLHSVISTIVTFYITKSSQEKALELGSEDESDEDSSNNILSLVRNACGLRSLTWTSSVLDKIVKILSLLLEAHRNSPDMRIRSSDWTSLVVNKGYYFLMQLIKDCNNSDLCGPLILSLCSISPKLMPKIVEAIFDRLQKSKEDVVESYFSVLNFIIDRTVGEEELDVKKLIIEKVWQLAKCRPLSALKWFETNVGRHKEVYTALKSNLEIWTEQFLFNAVHYNIRHTAAEVLVACIQSTMIRSAFQHICQKSLVLSPRQPISTEATKYLHEILEFLLSLIPSAYNYADTDQNGTQRLVSYFNVLKACLVSRDEKLMVVPYFNDLWRMYKAHMCEKQVKIHANKQSVLTFWYMASLDCSEMVAVAMKNQEVMQHFMYTYIFTQNEDELIEHNKKMLHAFYGLMKLFCAHSDKFAEMVMAHDNLDFACKSVTTVESYSNAKEEIFNSIDICFRKAHNQKEKLRAYRDKVFFIYLNLASATKTNFSLLLRFFKLVDSDDDKLYLLEHNILQILTENFFTIHAMHHTATGCNAIPDLTEILKRLLDILKFLSQMKDSKDVEKEVRATDALLHWMNMNASCTKLMELMNSFNPPEVRKLCMECVKKITSFGDAECLRQVLTLINQVHSSVRTSVVAAISGPYFPRRSHANSNTQQHLRRVHPPHPMLNMCLHSMQIEASKGVDSAYDQALHDYFAPYHTFVDRLLRCACNLGSEVIPAQLIAEVSSLLGSESVPLQLVLFPKFWLDVCEKLKEGKDVQDRIDALKHCDYFREYIGAVLNLEQSCLIHVHIYTFIQEILERLAPELVAADTKRLALENAISVLSESTSFADVDVERLPFVLHRRIGALRIMLLLCNSNETADQLKSLHFWQKLPSWLENIMRATTIDSPTSSSTADGDEKELIDNQQINRSVLLLKDVINELNAKFLKFVTVNIDVDDEKSPEEPSSTSVKKNF